MSYGENDFVFPFFLAEPIDTRDTEKIFDDVALAIGEIAEFERKEHLLEHERRAEASPETEKQHSSTSITAERLHGRIVDHLHGFSQRFAKVKIDPAAAQMFRFFCDLAVADRRRKTDRDCLEIPIACPSLQLCDKLIGLHLRSGIEHALLGALDHQFHVGAADVDDERLVHRYDSQRVATRRGRSLD